MRTYVMMAVALLIGAGCGSGEVTTTGTQDTDIVADTAETIDATVDLDVDANAPDVDEPDTLIGDDGDTAALAGLGEACADNADCESFYCVDLILGEGGSVCTERCTESCDEGFECILLTSSGGDAEQLCLPADLCIDADSDGYGFGPGCRGPDCVDDDTTINPGANELCDGVDQDCDDEIDEFPIDANQACDTGFGGACAAGRTVCESALLVCETEVLPVAELCNGEDDDCDGEIDEDPEDAETYYADLDGDLHGDPGVSMRACAAPGGWVTTNDDCDDTEPATYEGAPELCDELDNDCDGAIDNDVAYVDFYPDADGDGYGNDGGAATRDCAPPDGYAAVGGDCNDADPGVNPAAIEGVGDELDQNCDGRETCYLDGDSDGYRDEASTEVASANMSCTDPGEAVAGAPGGDCNDGLASVYPGALEMCDALDNDCNGLVDDDCTCAAGFQMCDGACIPNSACCTSADCTGGRECVSGVCACDEGTERLCGDTCIPAGDCCADHECGAGESCIGGTCQCRPNATRGCFDGDAYWFDSCGAPGALIDTCTGGEVCNGGTCGCPAGERYCGTTCIPNDSCCSDADCPASCSGVGGECCGDIGEACCGSACDYGSCLDRICADYGGGFEWDENVDGHFCAGRAGCSHPNPYTGTCGCPAGFSEQSAFGTITDCLGEATHIPGGMGICLPSRSAWPHGAFGGMYQMDDSWEPSACLPAGGRCRLGNSQTGGCSCPAGAAVMQMRTLADTTASCSWRPGGSWIYLCYDAAGPSETFGGAFQIDDPVAGGVGCRQPNPYTGSCTCAPGTVSQQFRVEVDSSAGFIGSNVHICR